MIKKLVFTRGLPGSGKSTYAHELKAKHHDSCFICSTDQYWERPDGVYDFNWELLGKSHVWNQRRVKEILCDEENRPWDTVVVVDNTNITFSEMKPYIKMAIECEFDIEFVEPDTEWRYDVEECFNRTTHGVPYATILKMSQRWEDMATVIVKLEKFKKEVE
jgi:hypothetical protein